MNEQEAKTKFCPLARTQGDVEISKDNTKCRGCECILWRWKPISVNDNRFMSAVKREQHAMYTEHLDQKPEKPKTESHFNKAAVQKVNKNIDGYVFRNEDDIGWCGLGGPA